ncbi:microcin C transport system substrate-binding protein [Monaibacterium marinum]|uniref:Microcin C transport system substrate-binding protein n=1 Tax=Pontivivens marinum TaxID=1690039 RepID=A0A2C9CMN2_9RHOB|nr:extracellular solute-binding protein [Monaibacterium marinum]SOH92513.1 microcin C transport system substrate-binding protein [Monaibacterium marinum]
MTRRRMKQSTTQALSSEVPLTRRLMLGLSGLVIATAMIVQPLYAQDDETIITAHGISSFGDLKYGPDFEHFDYVNPDAPRGGYFTTWGFGSFDSVRPYILRGNAAGSAGILYDSLLTGSADEPDALYGLVAETIEYPESREWIIFNIRPEARFHDGSPITAEDVAASYMALYEKGRPTYRLGIFRDVLGVEVLDEHRVKYTFRADAPLRDMPGMVGGLPIFPAAWLAENDFAESGLEPVPGSGPYQLESVEGGRSIVYSRVEDYWGADLPVNVGQNNFDEQRVEYYADSTVAFEQFKALGYTFRAENSSRLWATAYEFPALENGWVVAEELIDGTPTGTQGWWFNLRREKFQDPRVRQAIAMMFNFEWSNDALFYDLYARTDSFWENSYLQAEGVPDAQELAILEPVRGMVPETVFTEPAYSPIVSEPVQLDRRVLRQAAALLREAGYTLSDGTLIDANGEPFVIEILNDSRAFERIINPFIQNLERLGIRVEAPTVDQAQAAEREKNYEFDLTSRRYRMSLTPGQELVGIFGSTSANELDTANVMGLQNEGVDYLIEQIAQAEKRDELNVRVRALDRVLRSLHIWIPQFYSGRHFVAYLDVYGQPEIQAPYSIGTNAWWWDAEKADALRAAGAL